MRVAKVDANQAAIVKVLRQMGASVQPLHTVGQGTPDLLVGIQGRNYLLEVVNSIDQTILAMQRLMRD